MAKIITDKAHEHRRYWIGEIAKLSGKFGEDSARLEKELHDEIANKGVGSLVDHLRLCGDIPEQYGHDSSEEKLYSKYTDVLLCAAFRAIGLKSIVYTDRGDTADVETVGKDYSFVGDAKAFRLSRTAKNQKDFKVQAMDGWKRGKPFAMVVCPIYQLPTRSSQIYQQASARNVCVFTYSHLTVLVRLAERESGAKAQKLLHDIFTTVQALNPTKDANAYWLAINKQMIGFSKIIADLWKDEKQAAVESIGVAKEVALTFLAGEREKILKLSHEEALQALIRVHRIESRMKTIEGVCDNKILDIN